MRDQLTHTWVIAGPNINARQQQIIDYLKTGTRARLMELVEITGLTQKQRGNLYNELKTLIAKGLLNFDPDTKEYYA